MTRSPDIGLPQTSRFSAPDDHPGLDDLVAYLDNVEQLGAFRDLHAIADNWLAIEPGQSVLDLGCGLGRATREAANRAGPDGKVMGLDISQALLRIAKARSIDDPAPEYVHGDCSALPFPAETFDRVRAERLLMHVSDPAVVLSEIGRVLRPGGRVVLIEPDWGSLEIQHNDQAVCKALSMAFASAIKNPSIGADLKMLSEQAGLVIVDDKVHFWRSSKYSEIDLTLQFRRMAEIAISQGFHPGSPDAIVNSLQHGPIAAQLALTAVVAKKANSRQAGE